MEEVGAMCVGKRVCKTQGSISPASGDAVSCPAAAPFFFSRNSQIESISPAGCTCRGCSRLWYPVVSSLWFPLNASPTHLFPELPDVPSALRVPPARRARCTQCTSHVHFGCIHAAHVRCKPPSRSVLQHGVRPRIL